MAVRIDASSDYLNRTSSAPGQYPLTVTFWLYITTDRNAYGVLFLIANSGGTSFISFNLSSSGTNLQISVGGNTTNGSNLSTGTWYHIACVVASATSQKMYLNGVLDINKTTSSYTFTAAQYYLGSDSVGWLNGRLADVKMFDRELTVEEIKNEMADLWPVSYPAWAFYPMFAGASERVLDYGGGGRNLTANGTLTDEAGPPVGWGAQTPFGLFVSTTTAYSLNLAAGSYAITGAAATVTRARLFNAAAGSYSINGAANSLLAGRALNLAAGAYTLTGSAAALLVNRLLSLASGSYALTGAGASLLRGMLLALASGSYSLTGSAASLLVARLLALSAGSYALTGTNASLLHAIIAVLESGAHTLTGAEARLLADRLAVLGHGSYTVAGNDASILVSRLLQLEPGVYALAGAEATLTVASSGNYVLVLGSGAYSITGAGASLTIVSAETEASGPYPLLWPHRLTRRDQNREAILTALVMALHDD